MKIKIFEIKKVKEEEIDQFLAEHDIAQEGLLVRNDWIVVSYFDKSIGLRPGDMVESLEKTLAAIQGDILAWTIDLTTLEGKLQTLIDLRKDFEDHPDKPKMNPSPSELNVKIDKIQNGITNTKNMIDDHKIKMEAVKKVMAAVKAGEFTL